MERIRCERFRLDTAEAKTAALRANCEAAFQITQNARNATYGLFFSGRDDLAARLSQIENRLAALSSRAGRLGTMIASARDELIWADTASGIMPEANLDVGSGGKGGLPLSLGAAAAFGAMGQLSRLFTRGLNDVWNVLGSDWDKAGACLGGFFQGIWKWFTGLFKPKKVFPKETQVFSGDSYDKNTATFSDKADKYGLYGANQGSLIGITDEEDLENIYAFVRQYPAYRDATDEEIDNLLAAINAEGCSYAAMVNAIFVAYEGREDAFRETFGFDMCDENRMPNYDYLLLDYYISMDDVYYVNDRNGLQGFVAEYLLSYEDCPEKFVEKFGCEPFITRNGVTGYSAKAYQAVTDMVAGQDVIHYEFPRGATAPTIACRMRHYLEQRGVVCLTEVQTNVSALSASKIKDRISHGDTVTLCIGETPATFYDGSTPVGDVPNHAVTVTGIADDGRYIISSWGKRYYVDPSQLKDVDIVTTRLFLDC